MTMMNLIGTTAIAVCAFAVSASAATINVTGITGTWENVQGGGSSVNGEGTSNLRFGDPATSAGQSGYDFVAQAVPFAPASNPFDIGVFSHLNFPVFPPSITGADLRVTVEGDVDGVSFSLGGVYRFDHFETPNVANPCAAGGGPVTACPDLVTFLGAVSLFGDTIEVDGENVVLGLEGFAAGTSFLTAEGQRNDSVLRASFTANPITVDPVPLPAAGWMLLAGLGGLAAMRRRKNQA